jgi:NitT/TauT family transport system substrate-binding protein
MLAWIDQNGGDIKSVKLIETPFSEMGVALESGRIAAATFAEPFLSAALVSGQARVIGNASDCVAKHFMVTGWFSTTDWLAKNAATAKRLQTVMLQIARWANANRPETQLILPKYTKLTPEVAARMTRIRYGDTKPDPTLIQPVIDIAVKYGGMQSMRAADLIWAG